MPDTSSPSLYEQLLGNFTGGLDLHQVSDENQVILSVLDNMQRILNCRARNTQSSARLWPAGHE
ncbi:hypothetical [Yersinia pestis KIM10+]|uniref:Type VI secretion system lysozyme-like protein n=1 Tax=Yersinia pestis TaxID=632 RepID=Q8CKX4_YERPE|nr:hypothetical [Yersinia pestis KIM10+]